MSVEWDYHKIWNNRSLEKAQLVSGWVGAVVGLGMGAGVRLGWGLGITKLITIIVNCKILKVNICITVILYIS
jgi:hypothetical protein